MARFYFTAKVVSRGKGKGAVSKAAYNRREKLIDERTGEVKDFSHREDQPVFSGIFAPHDAPEWARDPQSLFNEVERCEKRKDAQLAVELVMALPHELTDEERRNIVLDFSREQFLRKRLVADVSIHPPPREPEEGKQPNHHVHILVALREIGPDGFGERAINSGSLEENARQIDEWREKWAERGGRELRKAGFELEAERYAVGHLTLPEQREAALERGDMDWAEHCNREPTKHRGPAVDAMARRGVETERGQQDFNAVGKEVWGREAELEADQWRTAEREIMARLQPEHGKESEPEPQIQQRTLNRAEADIRLALNQKEGEARWAASLQDWGYIVAEVQRADIEQRDRYELFAMREAKERGVWMFAEGGTETFTPEQMQSARASYDAWKERWDEKQEQKPSGRDREPFTFEGYVAFVQVKQQQRLEELTAQAERNPELEAKPPARLVSAYAKEGDLVVVNERGEIYSLNERTTGIARDELDKYLATVDRAALPNVLGAQATMRERRQPEIEREQEWWQRIEDAIERGGEFQKQIDRSENWLTQRYGPDLEHLREFRTEIVGMRQELREQLDDRSLSYEHRAALWEIAGELRDVHHDTSKQIATLLLERSGYEPGVIEMGRVRLSDFAETIKGAGREAGDLLSSGAEALTKYAEELISFLFDTPSLPTPEVMHARREAKEARTEQAEFDAKRWKEDDGYRAKVDEQDRLQREQEAQEYKRKQERELYPNERERER